MRIYRFKTYRTSYYFPHIKRGQEFLYKLYTPYSLLSSCYWWLFKHSSLLRWLNRVSDVNNELPYNNIIKFLPSGSVVSFNMGTPCPEQKISMLGVTSTGGKFFAKYSVKPVAVLLSKNEIYVLNALNKCDIAPQIIASRIGVNYCFFITSYIEGETVKVLSLNHNIVNLAIRINSYHLDGDNNKYSLKTGLSHGDFTPWNMLTLKGEFRMIDWERGGERELGYDLFYFIDSIISVLTHKGTLLSEINKSQELINEYFCYFGIDDWMPYLDRYMEKRHKTL